MKPSAQKIAYICFVFIMAGILSSYVAGPPPATTNAPGETTCATNGLCHSGAPNTGPGFGDITLMGGIPPAGYIPGQTYKVMPYLITNDSLRTKMGFQIVARLLSNGVSAGNAVITDPNKTQLVASGGYQYIEQTQNGANNPGMHDWMYNWTAPSAGSGAVIFYASFIASDGNGASSGDLIYTDTLVLSENANAVNEYSAGNNIIHSLFPNPCYSYLTINFSVSQPQIVSISVHSIDGKMVFKKDNIPVSPSHSTYRIAADTFPSGIYLIQTQLTNQDASHISVKRFVKL